MSFEAITSNGKYKEKIESEQEKLDKEREALELSAQRIQTRLATYLKAYPYLGQFTAQIDFVNGSIEVRLRLHDSRE